MDLRISSEEIRSYVSAQTKIAKQALPEESRRVILRMPTDSVNISPQSRALAKGRLRVAMEENGRYTEVTNDNSNPMMQLFDKGMSDVKEQIDKMKELTELMEDPEISIEDRYATQMRLVELEGELEKKIYTINEKYKELAQKLHLPMSEGSGWSAKGQPSMEDFARAGKVPGIDQQHYVVDRVTGEIFAHKKFSDMIDQRTELRKEAIERVMMRELDPEAFAAQEEKLREALRKEYDDLVDENGLMPFYNGPIKKERFGSAAADLRGTTFPTSKLGGPEEGVVVSGTEAGVKLSSNVLTPPDIVVETPLWVDWKEYNKEKYVEERLAEIEKGDYEELNAMRVSVMSASLAKESDDFLENLTNKLTEQFQRFAAQNELIGEENPSPESADVMNRPGQIAQIAKETLVFLRDTLFFGGIQKDTAREAKEDYNVKVEKTTSPTENVRDIFAKVTVPLSEVWQMYHLDLFAGENDSKHS